MMKKPKITARKWMGDDAYSWAVFVEGNPKPAFCGLGKREIPYYKKLAEEHIAKKSTS